MASGPCVPHQQAAHMAAPTRLKHRIKKTLAKGEPSTHDPKRALPDSVRGYSCEADMSDELDGTWW